MTPKLSESSKKSKLQLKLRKLIVEAKKQKFLEKKFYVHWSPFDSESSVLLKETRYEKWLVAR